MYHTLEIDVHYHYTIQPRRILLFSNCCYRKRTQPLGKPHFHNFKMSQNHKNNARRNRKGNKNARRSSNNLTTGGGGSVNPMVYEPWMPIFPPSITKTLRYSTTFAAASASGAISSTQVFRANDLFDPDYSGTGHQPMGFDQLMLWYNHFTVRTAKITLLCQNLGSATVVCLRVDGDLTPITVIDRVVEIGGCVLETLEGKGVTGANKKVSMSVDIARLQGVSQKTITADANLRGTAAASPSEVTYFHVTTWNTTGITTSTEIDVMLEQTATFFEPRAITESLAMHNRDELVSVNVARTVTECKCKH